MTNPQTKDKRAVEQLPEPARSLGRDTAARSPEAAEETSGEQTAEQMEEWVTSRAPGAKAVPQPEKKPG